MLFHVVHEIPAAPSRIFPWRIEEDAYRHLREIEEAQETFTIGHIAISHPHDMALVPCAILDTIIRRTELEDLDIGESRMSESGLEHCCHVVHVIGERPCDKGGIASGEDAQSIDRRCVHSQRSRIHLHARKGRRTGLPRGQTEIPIHMMQEEDIAVVTDGMDEMVDSFAQGRSVAGMGYDSEFRASDFYPGGKRQHATMESMDRHQSYLIGFIAGTADIIGSDRLLRRYTLQGQCLEQGFLYPVVSAIIAPGHDLVRLFEGNIDIRIFFEGVKHTMDNSGKREKI